MYLLKQYIIGATEFPDRSALLGGASDLEQHLCDQLPNFNVNFARHDYGVSYRPGHAEWGQIVLEGAFKSSKDKN